MAFTLSPGSHAPKHPLEDQNLSSLVIVLESPAIRVDFLNMGSVRRKVKLYLLDVASCDLVMACFHSCCESLENEIRLLLVRSKSMHVSAVVNCIVLVAPRESKKISDVGGGQQSLISSITSEMGRGIGQASWTVWPYL